MQTILLDGSRYADGEALHRALQAMLALPPYYGMNADALYDCLAARRETVHAWVLSPGMGDTARALSACLCVLEDLGGQVRFIGSSEADRREAPGV